MKRTRRKGFTWLELLVIVAIISILAAILIPVFYRARAKAQQVSCSSNLRQLSLAYMMYQNDEGEKLDPAVFGENIFEQALYPYVKNWLLCNCPSDVIAPSTGEKELYGINLSYGWNLLNLKEAKGRTPENNRVMPLVFDAAKTRVESPWKLEASGADNYPLCLRHSGGLNVAFFDGHAKWLSRVQVVDGIIDCEPLEKFVWVGVYRERPKTAEKAAFPNGTEEVADGIYVFRVWKGKAEQIAAGPLK